jgi:hypothetical protein
MLRGLHTFPGELAMTANVSAALSVTVPRGSVTVRVQFTFDASMLEFVFNCTTYSQLMNRPYTHICATYRICTTTLSGTQHHQERSTQLVGARYQVGVVPDTHKAPNWPCCAFTGNNLCFSAISAYYYVMIRNVYIGWDSTSNTTASVAVAATVTVCGGTANIGCVQLPREIVKFPVNTPVFFTCTTALEGLLRAATELHTVLAELHTEVVTICSAR